MMSEEYQMSMMGELKFFLGLQIRQQRNGIFISQEKYLKDVLRKFGMQDCKGVKIPMPTNGHLCTDENGIDFDHKVYRSMIGSLLYLCASRPDIMLSVCMCARFQATPKESHHKAVKHILRYLAHTPTLGLWYPKGSALVSLDILTLTMLVIVWTASQHLVLVISSDDLWSVGPRRNRTVYHYLLLKLSTLLLVLAMLNCCR